MVSEILPSFVSGSGNQCSDIEESRLAAMSLTRSSDLVGKSLALLEAATDIDLPRYNVSQVPPFRLPGSREKAPDLNQIVVGILDLLHEHNYPTEPVSISLVDLTGDCCEYGRFQDEKNRYPASIVKLFWLVALYGQYEDSILQPNVDLPADDEMLMAHYSNNGASSRVLDAITQTESGEALDEFALADWIKARSRINTYFQRANYPDLNLAHKTFPIEDLGLAERAGRDLQFSLTEIGANAVAKRDQNTPTNRNYLSTYATARLLYEIDSGQAISKRYSDRIKDHLKHSTDPAVWQREAFNAIEGFFGEYLPADVDLYTKLGFTFDDGRQEAAIIASPDGQTRFILVVFANDSIYSQEDSKLFPEIARYVYEQMRSRTLQQVRR